MAIALNALIEVIEATLPVLGLIFIFQVVILRQRPRGLMTMLIGIVMAMVGFWLFIIGAKISLIPMGMQIGEVLSALDPLLVTLLVFVLGVAIIIAEPAVRILAYEIEEVSSGSLRKRLVIPAIAIGVGLALALGWLRVRFNFSLLYILVPGYLLILLLTYLAPAKTVPLAYDAGAVATGPVAVNFVLPMTTGMALSLWGEQAGIVGFGVVGVIAMCPIIGMLLLGIILGRRRYE